MDKKIFAIIIAVAIVFFLAGSFIPFRKVFAPKDGNSFLVSVAPIYDESNKLYQIKGEYPQFNNLPDDFNRSISLEVESRLKDFKMSAEENWRARQETLLPEQKKQEFPDYPFYFSSVWEPKQINEKYVSFVIRFDSYEGGANGRSELKTYNYDISGKKVVELKDLFPNNSDYLSDVSEFARKALMEDMKKVDVGYVSVDMINDGTKPKIENFSNFVFNGDVIVFYFPKYQVAPGASGEQKVIMGRVK